MSAHVVEIPTNINFTPSHFAHSLNMSNAVLNHEPEVDDCQFENILSQLEQYFPLRHQVANVLKEASAALAIQCTQPDGYRYMQTCDDLAKFLDLKVPLEYSEQQLVRISHVPSHSPPDGTAGRASSSSRPMMLWRA